MRGLGGEKRKPVFRGVGREGPGEGGVSWGKSKGQELEGVPHSKTS